MCRISDFNGLLGMGLDTGTNDENNIRKYTHARKYTQT